jgi:regulatory protein
VSEADARELALRALRHRDRSRQELDESLARAGASEEARAEALDRLAEAGIVSDERFSLQRSRVLAERGAGDELIRADLRSRGVASALIDDAIDALEPEAERAARAFAARGGDVRAVRYLARKGFRTETVERLTALNPLD